MKRSKDKFYMKQIFDCISDGEIIATGKIAKEIGLSEKSVRNRLNELSDFLLENKLGEIQRKPRVGIWLEANENQKEEIEKFAARKNLTVNRWVTEVVSGKKKENDRKLGRLLKSLKKGDVLIVTELSRLSRTLLDIMSILHRCLEMNITVYSTKDGYAFDNSINSKVLAFAFALVAEIEHNLISMRTKEALAHRKSEGVRLGRPPGKGKQNVLLDNREEIRHLLDEGMSVSAVCRIYNVSRETFYAVNRKHQLFS